MQRSWSPGTLKPLIAHGQVTSQLQFSKYVPDSRQLTPAMIPDRSSRSQASRCRLGRRARRARAAS